jgi:predicted phosphodiesterase
MRRKELDNMRVVLDALWRDLPDQIARVGGKLDFVAFTGDIAHSGKEEEYRLAEEHFFEPLLENTVLSLAELFVVPGNHDTDWDLIEYVNPAIAESLTNRDKVTDLLKSDVKRRILFAPMEGYARFVHRLFSKCPAHQILRDPFYSYAQIMDLENYSVALIGLNSAWLSGFKKDAKGKVTDRGNMLIGDKQISDALREVEGATMRIALMHHPIGWLTEFDERDAERWLQPACDFVLQGHLHDPKFKQEKTLGGDTIIIPAGTVYKGRDWLNGYNLVCLDFETGKGKIFLYRYSEARREWVEDVMSTGKGTGGSVEFDLPGVPDPEVSPPSPLSPTKRVLFKIEPDWLCLGRERDIQLLEDFFQQKGENTLWIWGDEGCGLIEFLNIARALLQREGVDVIYFDPEDAAFGIAVDQDYFLDKLEHWTGTAPEATSGQIAEDRDKRLRRFLVGAESRLSKSDRRLALIFANYHLLSPTLRDWLWTTFWGQMLEPLNRYGTLALFACEGSAPTCPASAQKNRIRLTEFTVRDVERFLHKLSFIDSEEISDLAQKVHSENTDEYLVSPQWVYQNLITEVVRRSSYGRGE